MSFVFDFYRTLRFATRLPLPVLKREEADPIVSADAFAPAFAASGAVVGLIGGLVMGLALLLSADAMIAAFFAVAAMILSTGALHEDGLADCADGLGGGRTRERKLEIMRDSAIGTYGVLALIMSVGMRVAALASLAALGLWAPLAALLATQTLSRALAMVVASLLDHARPDGAAARLGRPSKRAAGIAVLIAWAVSILALWPMAGAWSLLVLVVLLLVGAVLCALVARTAKSQIGGQTGDILGATQQLTDLAALFTLSISVSILF